MGFARKNNANPQQKFALTYFRLADYQIIVKALRGLMYMLDPKVSWRPKVAFIAIAVILVLIANFFRWHFQKRD
jgi:hypothetical protein